MSCEPIKPCKTIIVLKKIKYEKYFKKISLIEFIYMLKMIGTISKDHFLTVISHFWICRHTCKKQ